MYYAEKVENGQLFYQTTPGGEWKPKTGPVADIIKLLCALPTDEKRLEVFTHFCEHCGEQTSTGCYCMCDD